MDSPVFDHALYTYVNRHGPDPDPILEVPEGATNGTVVMPLAALQTVRDSADYTGIVDTDVIIVRVMVGDQWGYGFLPVYDLNMEYVHGARSLGDATVSLDVR